MIENENTKKEVSKKTSALKLQGALLPFVGFSFVQCWVLALFSSPAFAGSQNYEVARYFHWASIGASFICALCILTFATRLIPLSHRRLPNFAISLLTAGAGLLSVLGTYSVVPLPASLAGFVIAGAGSAWIFLCWQEFVSTQGAKIAITAMLVSLILGSALYLVFHLFPSNVASLCCLFMPVLSVITLRPQKGTRFYHTNRIFSGSRELFSDIAHDISPKFMIVCALLACSGACLRSFQFGVNESVGALALPVVSLCIAGVLAGTIVLTQQGGGIEVLLVISIILCAVGAGTLIFEPLMSAGVPAACGCCAANAMYYTVWLLLLERSHARKLPVLGVLASLWMANYLGFFVGQVIGIGCAELTAQAGALSSAQAGLQAGAQASAQLGEQATSQFGAQSTSQFGAQATSLLGAQSASQLGVQILVWFVMACLLVAALVYAGVCREKKRLVLSNETYAGPVETGADSADEPALLLANKYSLSAREVEVMLMWCQGHTQAYLEENLFISRNTVKTHLRNIYRKTGAHDRDSLLALIDETKAKN